MCLKSNRDKRSKFCSSSNMATCTIENHAEESVVQQLNELFGNVLNLDIIKTVAVSCRYDVTESSNKLLEITTTMANGKITTRVENKKSDATPASCEEYARYPLDTYTLSTTHLVQNKSKKALDIERAIKYIQKGYKVLIIMRGVPGCGKSYLAKRILESTIGFDGNYKLHILSTDDFFTENGVYRYDPNRLSEGHGWNHNRAFQAMSRGFSPVIIDNTNTQLWEMKPYAMMATDYGYFIEILEPDTHWCFNEKELAKRNSHGVTKSKIKEMLERYEKNITPQKLLSAYNLTYRLQKPPQPRLYPPLNISSLSTSSVIDNIKLSRNWNSEVNVIKSNSVSVLNGEIFKTPRKPMETINLMDFNDDETTYAKLEPVITITSNYTNSTADQNSVDKILMCANECENENVIVLQPSQQNKMEVISISSDEENEATQSEKKMFPDLETAWGINENALRSWDIVTPIRDEGNFTQFHQPSTTEHNVVTQDSSCNTEEEYFRLLRIKQINSNDNSIRIVDTLNRDINRSTPKRDPTVLKKPMHDKSCLTEDIFEDYEHHMSQLVNLFPSVPKSHLKYWYNKCRGDLEWTIEFLLEAKEEISSLIEESLVDNEQTNDIMPNEGSGSDSSSSSSIELLSSNEIKNKRCRKNSDNNNLKKLIESKIDINDEHYSKHLLKVKQCKFGNGSSNSLDSLKSTTEQNDSITVVNPPDDPKCYSSKPSTSVEQNYMTDTENAVMVDSDIELDEFDLDDNNDKTEETPELTTELNLGENFVAQLEEKFGDPNMAYPKGFQPVVQVPVTLARQLYTFYIESVYQQMENQKQVLDSLIKEDEEFAKKLQAKEEENIKPKLKEASNLQDIMDEQVAQNIYQKEAESWKNLNPDNLAARLTRQKLFSVFPTIDKDTLIEILYAHGNKYEDTVETLLASTGPENVRGSVDAIKEPPLREEVVQEMKEAQMTCINETYDEQHEATFYREEANKYLKKRVDLYQKAQQYHQRGMTEVAQFYSGLASKQTIYFDRANNMAATAFLDEHSKRLQDFNTIDLHFLYVKEAIPALDVFIDRNINLLRLSNTKQSEYLQIITGRGKRSENGVSKIRPVVIARLKKRKIKFVQLNPGLLKVKITKNSIVTSEMQELFSSYQS